MIYLDNAATTYPKPEQVLKRLDEINRTAFNSGRGSYKVAKDMSILIDSVRKKILEIDNILDGRVVFTSSATVALNDIIFGTEFVRGDNVYISPFEHNSVVRPLEYLKDTIGINIIVIPFKNETWEIDENKLQNLFASNKPKMILLSQISNATGFILPYNDIFKMAEKYKTINILDCSQGFGIMKIENINLLNYVIFAGHKSLYGSFGIGGYIKLKDDKLKIRLFGGTGSDTMSPSMNNNYEAGSPNIVAISSIDSGIDWLKSVDIYNHERKLTDYLIGKLSELKSCQLHIPINSKKIFGIVSFSIKGYSAEEVGQILDSEYDICLRTGYHCAPLIHELIDSLKSNGTVRASLSYFNTTNDIDELIVALKSL